MSKRKKNYTTEFKEKAVELSYARGNVVEVSKELGIPYSVLHRWRKESESYGKNSFPGRGKPKLTDEQKEIAELRKQLKDVSLENEILKKAVSIFSKSDK
jgi:transposase